MSRKAKRAAETKVKNRPIRKLLIVAILLGLVYMVLKLAPNYINDDITNMANLVINNSNITRDLKHEVIIENGVIYLSQEDIENFFDPYIYYDEQYNQIITTSDNQIASMVIGEKSITNNGTKLSISGAAFERDGTIYIPISSLDNVYNIEINYIDSSNTITVDSRNRKYVLADSTKDSSVKAYPTIFSRTVDELTEGETFTVVQNDENQNEEIDGWTEIRTDTGKLGYIKSNTVTHEYVARDELDDKKQIEGTVSMVWDYYHSIFPDRTGTHIDGINVISPTFFTLVDEGRGAINDNAGEQGKSYVEWAHSNGYMVWPSISNNSYIETTSEIMHDYNLRNDLIQNIVSLVLEYDLDGINIDFEYMHDEDKDLFSRFIIELKPRLNEMGVVLSVDVTAPDGSDEWSLCYDRHVIGDVADYIVFMAYDQYGSSSTVPGTTAGYNWVEANIQKFLGQEEVEADKIILGIPFYAWVWDTTNGVSAPRAIYMENLESLIPEGTEKVWNEELKQYYVEFTNGNTTTQIWLEDEQSIEAKLSLIEKYGLAGAAYWAKDREPDSIWSMISETLGV